MANSTHAHTHKTNVSQRVFWLLLPIKCVCERLFACVCVAMTNPNANKPYFFARRISVRRKFVVVVALFWFQCGTNTIGSPSMAIQNAPIVWPANFLFTISCFVLLLTFFRFLLRFILLLSPNCSDYLLFFLTFPFRCEPIRFGKIFRMCYVRIVCRFSYCSEPSFWSLHSVKFPSAKTISDKF